MDGAIDAAAPVADPDPLQGLPTGAAEWSAVCAKGYGDKVSAAFCAGAAPPVLTSIADLETLLAMKPVSNPTNDPNVNKSLKVTLTGLSTGLGLRTVTPLNPRAFIMSPPAAFNGPATPGFVVLAFARGEPLVEIVAHDPTANTLRFFLVRFHPACEATQAGCSNADLLTPTIESGWTDYTFYDDDTIKDTTLDCLNCHQPGGPSSKRILRMQELQNPWDHWFYIERPNNAATMQDFDSAHGTETYAGIPNDLIHPSRPQALTNVVADNGFGTQPNQFDSNKIESEIASGGTSATWSAMYAKSVAGTEIPTPYFGVPQTDPAKVAPMIAAYQQVMAGSLPPDQLPDIRDTLLDAALPDMSIRPKAGLDGRGVLTHMCRMCHNSSLDQTLSRAKFDVDQLDTMSSTEKQIAIGRLMKADNDAHKMPPVRFHVLSDAERQLAIDELSK